MPGQLQRIIQDNNPVPFFPQSLLNPELPGLGFKG